MGTGKGTALSAEDRERITQAVQEAEQHTSAEIVPMIVARSGLYRDAQHVAGLIAAFLTLAAMLTIEVSWVPWGWHASNAAWLVLAVTLAYVSGSVIGRAPAVVRLLTSHERMQQKVALRAERAFAQHAVSQTRERTGVLIMLSILEKQIYVLPDRSLVGLVSAERWQQVVQAAVARLHNGDIAEGLSRAIQACGLVLAEACPGRPGDNPNELPDEPIQEG
ncbi:TPM domain-containing protein [Nitrospira sp. NS4]|uniref:TPM domain-containing protein n=1 Tax=Nitrospira sp. NS4 TaxID=3414498 RepID=UPI003C2CE36F